MGQGGMFLVKCSSRIIWSKSIYLLEYKEFPELATYDMTG